MTMRFRVDFFASNQAEQDVAVALVSTLGELVAKSTEGVTSYATHVRDGRVVTGEGTCYITHYAEVPEPEPVPKPPAEYPKYPGEGEDPPPPAPREYPKTEIEG